MYEAVWKAVGEELSGERAREFTRRIWEHARWNSFDRMQQTAAEIAAIGREIGFQDVEVIELPADGVTAFGGWVMPQAWDAEAATLEIVEPQVSEPLLADYRACPQSLMMYSAPTPRGGVEAEAVVVEEPADKASWEGLALDGKLVLMDAVGTEFAERAFERGAVGIVSDAMKLKGSPQEKTPGHFDHAVQWHNYTVPPWKADRKRFGFAISPADGGRLRELLRSQPAVRLHAVVHTRLYDGKVPLVTGLLPGRTSEEIVLTAHLCEPGANDNCSGCALGLEVVRTLKALAEGGKIPPLERGLRIVYSFEVRGYQAFLAMSSLPRRFLAGLNLDMVGNELSEARSMCNLVFNFPSLPAYTDFLALELLRRLQREDRLFRFRTEGGALVDNLFGEPSVGAPVVVLGCWPDASYHTSLDVIDTISPKAMAGLGRVAAAYCGFLASAGFSEAVWLAQLTARAAEEELAEAARCLAHSGGDPDQLDYLAQKNAARMRSVTRLVRSRGGMPTKEWLAENHEWLCSWSHLSREEELKDRIGRLSERVLGCAGRLRRTVKADQRYARKTDALPKAKRPAEPEAEPQEQARRLAPVRQFKGSLCFEVLDAAGRKELKERTGLTVGWGAPYWLQLACFLASGRRTALDIWRRLRWEAGVSLEALCGAVEFLADHGFVRLRPVLGKAAYLEAFQEVGLPSGCVVMVHSSLSRFGYVEGGADTVVDALLEAIGPEGTLTMPTLSFSLIGRPPYDPATTPSRVGAITEAFRRRPGVLRSGHPTHSVAAFGPLAEELTRHHSPHRPVFATEGPYGKLYEFDAYILMLAPLGANTTFHMAEERAGIPLPDLVGHVHEGRTWRETQLVRMPCHANFDPHYHVLRERGLLRSAPLGEDTIYLMRVRDAIDVAVENLRRNPLLVTVDGCECELCRRTREMAEDTGRS